MYRIVKFKEWEIIREWYCRTEEKAKEIVRTLVQEDYKLNTDSYEEVFEQEDWTLEEFIEWVWEEKTLMMFSECLKSILKKIKSERKFTLFLFVFKVLGLLKVLGSPTLYHTTTLKSISRTRLFALFTYALRPPAYLSIGAALAHFCQEELGARL